MPTGGEEFTSLVQGGPTWFEYYVVDLLDTKVTLFGGRVERLASLEDFPLNGVRDVSLFQSPNIFAERSAFSFNVVEVTSMLIKAFLEWAGCQPSVRFD